MQAISSNPIAAYVAKADRNPIRLGWFWRLMLATFVLVGLTISGSMFVRLAIMGLPLLGFGVVVLYLNIALQVQQRLSKEMRNDIYMTTMPERLILGGLMRGILWRNRGLLLAVALLGWAWTFGYMVAYLEDVRTDIWQCDSFGCENIALYPLRVTHLLVFGVFAALYGAALVTMITFVGLARGLYGVAIFRLVFSIAVLLINGLVLMVPLAVIPAAILDSFEESPPESGGLLVLVYIAMMLVIMLAVYLMARVVKAPRIEAAHAAITILPRTMTWFAFFLPLPVLLFTNVGGDIDSTYADSTSPPSIFDMLLLSTLWLNIPILYAVYRVVRGWRTIQGVRAFGSLLIYLATVSMVYFAVLEDDNYFFGFVSLYLVTLWYVAIIVGLFLAVPSIIIGNWRAMIHNLYPREFNVHGDS